MKEAIELVGIVLISTSRRTAFEAAACGGFGKGQAWRTAYESRIDPGQHLSLPLTGGGMQLRT
jgi:hypothetical protein